MRRQLAYEPGDMTTTVQAGMPLGDLQDALKAEGQFVALDPPATAATTIGGVIATNASGPRRLLYGTARDRGARPRLWWAPTAPAARRADAW